MEGTAILFKKKSALYQASTEELVCQAGGPSWGLCRWEIAEEGKRMSSYRSGPGQSGTEMLALYCPPRAGEDRGQIGTGARSACLIFGVRGAQPRRRGPPWRNGEGENTTRCRGNGGLGTCSHLFFFNSLHTRALHLTSYPPPLSRISQNMSYAKLPPSNR